MHRLPLLVMASGALVAAASSVRSVEACSTEAPPPHLEGMPKDGEVVPPDVLPVYDRTIAGLDDPTIQDAQFVFVEDSGAMVHATPRLAYIWHFEIVPDAPLKPNTHYILQGQWTHALALAASANLSFTTSDESPGAVPDPPRAAMTHYVWESSNLTSCSAYPSGTCVSLSENIMVQACFIDGFGQERDCGMAGQLVGGYLYSGSFGTNLSGVDQGTDFKCVNLRTRAKNGALSKPVVLCGKDAPTYKLKEGSDPECTAQGLVHNGIVVRGNEGEGCSCATGRRVQASSPSLVMMIVGYGALRRRRRQRQPPASRSRSQ